MAFISRSSGGSRKRDYVSIFKNALNSICGTLKDVFSNLFRKVSSHDSGNKTKSRTELLQDTQERAFIGGPYVGETVPEKSCTIYIRDPGDDVFSECEYEDRSYIPSKTETVAENNVVKTTLRTFNLDSEPAVSPGVSEIATVDAEAVPKVISAESAETNTEVESSKVVVTPTRESEKVIPTEVEVEPSRPVKNGVVVPHLKKMKENTVKSACCQYDDEISAAVGIYDDDVCVEEFKPYADDGYVPEFPTEVQFFPHPVADRDVFADENGMVVNGMQVFAPLEPETFDFSKELVAFGEFAEPIVKEISEIQPKTEVQDSVPVAIFSFGASASASGCTVTFTF